MNSVVFFVFLMGVLMHGDRDSVIAWTAAVGMVCCGIWFANFSQSSALLFKAVKPKDKRDE